MTTVIVRALRGVSVDFYPGEYIAIMGQSGSGKSTMLNLLGCLDRPTSGEYYLGGRDISGLDDDELSEIRSRYLGFIFQSYNLIQQYTVLENIQLPLTYQGTGEISEEANERSVEVARLVGLGDRLDHRPSQLSGGQQQRVAIARSLINDPYIILADEATGNLDTATSYEIMEMLEKLNDAGKTIIMVTHEDDIAAWAKRVIRMRDGLIIDDSPSPRRKTGTGETERDGPRRWSRRSLGSRIQSTRSRTGTTERRTDTLKRVTMGRIWRAVRLGMKSLLLHKLRSGLTVLGIVFGVAAVISMLSIAEGTSRVAREQIRALGATNIMVRSVKPSDEAQATGGRPSRILNYGLKYSDFDRMVETIPTIRKVLPIREIRKQIRHNSLYLDGRVVGTTHDYADFNLLTIEKGRFLTASDNEKYQNFAVLAAKPPRHSFPYEDPRGQSIKLGTDYYTVVGVTKKRDSSAGIGGSIAAQDFNKDVYIPLNTCKLRFGERIINSRSGSMEAEETQLTQITLQVGYNGRRAADRPADQGRLRALSSQERRRDDGALRPAAASAEASSPVQHHPGNDRRDLALGGWNRDHEHHAGDRDRTNSRDRHPACAGGQAPRHHPTVLDRDRRARGRWRVAWRGRRVRDPADHHLLHPRSEGHRYGRIGHAGVRDLGCDRHLVRDLPRSTSRDDGPDRSAAARMSPRLRPPLDGKSSTEDSYPLGLASWRRGS